MKCLAKRAGALLCASLLLFTMTACKSKPSTADPSAPPSGMPETTPTAAPVSAAPTAPAAKLVPWPTTQVVEHLFFHQVICYPELAFDGDKQQKGFDDWMVTVDEFKAILESCSKNNYVLVDMNDVWSEYTNENGETRMRRNSVMVPEGKKPLCISYDDISYYYVYANNGFPEKLILGDDGDVWSYGHDPQGNEVISQDLDGVTILDKFVKEHPDFSVNGAKACLSLTGYNGILGYRTQTDTDHPEAAFEENRQKEIAAVKPIVKRLKETGWTFGSHTWGHIKYENMDTATIQKDMNRWLDEVGSLVGPTDILFYPHGSRPDGNHDQGDPAGPQFQWLQEKGFRIFASVGINSFEQVKKKTSAVIIDRLHPDGTVLRNAKDIPRYQQFFNIPDIYDAANRPAEYGHTW